MLCGGVFNVRTSLSTTLIFVGQVNRLKCASALEAASTLVAKKDTEGARRVLEGARLSIEGGDTMVPYDFIFIFLLYPKQIIRELPSAEV
jgi:hypothetical protein